MAEEKTAVASGTNETPAAPAAPKQSRIRRILRWAGLMLLALLAAVWLFLTLFLDRTVAVAVDTVGPEITGTPVELRDVKIGIWQGRVELIGFRVGNPAGFSAGDAFLLRNFICQVEPRTVLSDRIVVPEVTIDGVLVNYEPQLTGPSNLATIQRNVERFSGDAAAPATPATPAAGETAAASPAPAKKVIIRKLTVRNIDLAVTLGGQRLTFPLPPIELTDLGEGKPLNEMIGDFYAALMRGVANVVSSDAFKNAGASLQEAGEAVSRSLQEAGDKLGKSLNENGGNVEKSLQDAGDGLKKSLQGLKGVF